MSCLIKQFYMTFSTYYNFFFIHLQSSGNFPYIESLARGKFRALRSYKMAFTIKESKNSDPKEKYITVN